MNWQTKEISLVEAKQLLATIKKPGKRGAWSDYGGKDGVLSEVDLQHLTFEQLKKIQLPDFCCCITAEGKVLVEDAESLPAVFDVFRRGNPLWINGACNFVKVWYISRRFRSPVSFSFSQETESQYFGGKNNWDASCEFSMGWGTNVEYFADDLGLASIEDWPVEECERSAEIDEVIRKYAIPQEGSKGVIKVRRHKETIRVIMNLEHPWTADSHDTMIREMCKEDAVSPIHVTTSFSIEASATYVKGEKINIRDKALETIELVQKREDFDEFSVLYSMLKPEDWRAREKRRKKWEKPILQEMGNLTLENQMSAQVKILIEKDGYVFILDFPNDDEAMLFPDTRLFNKAEWHSGDE